MTDFDVLYLAFHGKKQTRKGVLEASIWISDAADWHRLARRAG